MVVNDDINSFDHVIHTLQDVFSYDVTQAANCADLVHRKGGYVVKWFDNEQAALYVAQVLRSRGLTTKLIIDKSETIP